MKINQSEYGITTSVRTINDVNLSSRCKITNLQYRDDTVELSEEFKYTLPAVGCKEVEFIYSIKTDQITARAIISDKEQVEIKVDNLPKELKAITNPIQLSKFLKNSYAKVTSLSNGEYKLYLSGRLLGGGKEYLDTIIKATDDRLHQRISSKEAFERFNIDYIKYNNVDDAILVPVIGLVTAVAIEELKQGRISVDNIDSVHFENAIDVGIFGKQKELIDTASYESLFSLSNGLQALRNRIFNKEDPFTIHVVKYFFNSVDVNKASDTDIKQRLTNERFICHIYVNLIARLIQTVNKQFIDKFQKFEIQKKPTPEEYQKYNIPETGFCHGACITIAAMNDFSKEQRDRILLDSVKLQQEYHKIRNPNQTDINDLLVSNIVKAVGNLQLDNEDKPPHESIRLAVSRFYNPTLPKNQTQKFLEENNISFIELLVESRTQLQEEALQNNENEELRIFANAETVLNDSTLSIESFNTVLKSLNEKLLASEGQKKHMILITLREKADMSKAAENITQTFHVPQTHDILIRVDTNTEGNITRVIFSDLQETGLHIIEATNSSKTTQKAVPQSVKLLSFYVEHLALSRFSTISTQYTENVLHLGN